MALNTLFRIGTLAPFVVTMLGASDPSGLVRGLSTDATGNLNVNLAAGSISGGNAAAAPTGAAVPASADYLGINVGGNLIGVTGFSLASSKAAAVAIVDGTGNQITSFGGGTQFADNAASGATPTGTLSMGWDSVNAKIRALKVDASQNLLISGNVGIVNGANQLAVDASGRITVLQGAAPWSENITQFGGNPVVTGLGASGVGIPRVTVSNDTQVKIWDGTNQLAIDGTGRITVLQGVSPWGVNLTQIGGSALVFGQATRAGSIPVVIASDQTSIPVTGGSGGGSVATDILSRTIIADNGGATDILQAILMEARITRAALVALITETGSLEPSDFDPSNFDSTFWGNG